MGDRFNEWMEKEGFERPLGLHEEVERIIERYKIEAGELDLEKLEFHSVERYSLFGSATGANEPGYRLTERVDPRAYDFIDLSTLAYDRGWGDRINATLGGTHGTFSFHYDGRAMDLKTHGW